MSSKDNLPDGTYRGGDDSKCWGCGGVGKIPWRGGLWCVVCDQPQHTEGTWFMQWGATPPEGAEDEPGAEAG